MPIQVTPDGEKLRFLSRRGSLLDIDDVAGTVNFPVPTGVQFGGTSMPVTVDDMTKLNAVTATAAELNDVDVSARTQAITAALAIDLDARHVTLAGPVGAGTYAVTLAAPTRPGVVKTMISGAGDKTVTLSLANCIGQSAGTGATFDAADELLVVVAGTNHWIVLQESGVTLA
jgi:hypothetical protein